jgi:hypothetical protein
VAVSVTEGVAQVIGPVLLRFTVGAEVLPVTVTWADVVQPLIPVMTTE